MYETVMEKIKKPIVFNICMLGVLTSLHELVNPDSIVKVLETRISPDFLDLNRNALELGVELGTQFKDE